MGRKSVGSSAGVLALIAILVHALGGSDSERRTTQREPQAMPDLSAFAGNSEAKELPLVSQGPWTTTQQFFHSEPRVENDALAKCLQHPSETCLPPRFVNDLYAFPNDLRERPNLRALIATVPDPLHTRMSLETDRYLDAIKQAAFDAGYELANQWLPWTVKAATEKTGAVAASSGKTFDWERLPGLLLFRHHFFAISSDKQSRIRSANEREQDSLLLVFVVGETPTAGVNGSQFVIARSTIRALSHASSSPEFYIAGPNFSGSFPSITHLLEDPAFRGSQIQMRSGTVTNDRYAAQMLNELRDKSVSFYSSVPPGSAFPEQLSNLAFKYHIKPAYTAQILETETGFAAVDPQGETTRLKPASPLIIRYPRDIAQLRNAYNDAAFAYSPGQNGTASPPPVDFSLKDTQAGEDEFPTFSTSHTPISQDAVLEQIAQRIKRNRIRLVGLSASNIFDALFLTNFLRRHCPDTRVVLPSADLLFVEDAAVGSLSGLMAISPFPLFPQGIPLPKSQKATDVPTFASSDQTAEFNAVLSLLGAMGATRSAAGYRQAYAPALMGDGIPAAWVLVLSSQGWMPVDWLPQPALPRQVKEAGVQWWDTPKLLTLTSDSVSALGAGGALWLALCAITALTTFAVCFNLWRLKLNPQKRVWSCFCLEDSDPKQSQSLPSDAVSISSPSASDSPLEAQKASRSLQILRSRYFCMTACFSNLAVANALFLCPMLANKHNGEHYWMILATTVAAFCWASLTCVLLASRWTPKHTHSPQGTCLNVSLLVIAVCTIGAWCYCCFFNHSASAMFNFRTLELAGSVCPLWPLLLTTVGLGCMAFFQLRRFTWCNRRQPYLDTSLFDELLKNEFAETKDLLETSLTSSTGMSIWKAARRLNPWLEQAAMLCWLFVLSLIVFFLLGDSLTSFESRPFTYTLEGLFAILVVFTISNLFRFLNCWKILRAFLTNLNSIVLGSFFSEVSEFAGSGGPVWIRDVKLMSLSTAINGYIALHNLDCIRQTPFWPGASEYRMALQAFLCASNDLPDAGSAQPKTNQSWRQRVVNFNREFRLVVSKVLRQPGGELSERQRFVEAYNGFRLCANRISMELGEQILKPYWRNNRLAFVAVDPAHESAASSVAEPKSPTDATPTPNVLLDLAGAPLFTPRLIMDRLELVFQGHPEESTRSTAKKGRTTGAAATVSRSIVSGKSGIGMLTSADAADCPESETDSKSSQLTTPPSKEEYELASRYIALHYSAYIGYVLHQLQNLLIASTLCFVLVMLGLNSFAFQAPQTIFHLASASVIIAGVFVLSALAQMERNPILSRLSGSTEGELGKDFYIRALSFGALPILAVLGTEFPSISQYIASWIQPMSAALH